MFPHQFNDNRRRGRHGTPGASNRTSSGGYARAAWEGNEQAVDDTQWIQQQPQKVQPIQLVLNAAPPPPPYSSTQTNEAPKENA